MNNLGRERAGGGCAACGRLESFGWPRCLLSCWWRDLAEFGRFYSPPAADGGQSYGPRALGNAQVTGGTDVWRPDCH
jgi:hypothetical protein